MTVLRATFPLGPEERDEALDLLDDLVERSRAEDGMIDYGAATDVSDTNVGRFFEQYEGDAAFDAHSRPDHF